MYKDRHLQLRISAEELQMIEELVDIYRGNLSKSDIVRAGIYHMYYDPDCRLRALAHHEYITAVLKHKKRRM